MTNVTNEDITGKDLTLAGLLLHALKNPMVWSALLQLTAVV